MKKIFAVVLVISVLLSLGISVLAADPVVSPTAPKYITVEVVKGEGDLEHGWKTNIVTIKEGDTVTVSSDDKHGKFDNWIVYTFTTDANGKRTYKVATYGKDYEIVIDDVDTVETLIKMNPGTAASVINSFPELLSEVLKIDEASKLEDIIASNPADVAKLVLGNKDATLKLASNYSEYLLTQKKMNILAHTDVIAAANYNGKITDLYEYYENGNKEPVSPKTGDSSIYFVFAGLIAMVGVCFSAKKALCK